VRDLFRRCLAYARQDKAGDFSNTPTIFREFGKTRWSRKHQQSNDFSRLFYYRPSYASCFSPAFPTDWFLFAYLFILYTNLVSAQIMPGRKTTMPVNPSSYCHVCSFGNSPGVECNSYECNTCGTLSPIDAGQKISLLGG